jgi:hypothetical protein
MKSYGIRNGVRPTITTAGEGTIALVAGDKGAIFYNTDTDSLRTWDGSAFQDVGGGGGTVLYELATDGNIGDPLQILSGKAEKIASTLSIGNEVGQNGTQTIKVIKFDPFDDTRFAVATDDGSTAYLSIYSLPSNGTVSLVSQDLIPSFITIRTMAWSKTVVNKIIFGGLDASYPRLLTCLVVGAITTFGTMKQNTAMTVEMTIVCHPTVADRWMCAYSNSSNQAFVVPINTNVGNTITFGTTSYISSNFGTKGIEYLNDGAGGFAWAKCSYSNVQVQTFVDNYPLQTTSSNYAITLYVIPNSKRGIVSSLAVNPNDPTKLVFAYGQPNSAYQTYYDNMFIVSCEINAATILPKTQYQLTTPSTVNYSYEVQFIGTSNNFVYTADRPNTGNSVVQKFIQNGDGTIAYVDDFYTYTATTRMTIGMPIGNTPNYALAFLTTTKNGSTSLYTTTTWVDGSLVGILQETGITGEIKPLRFDGIEENLSGLTIGGYYFMSTSGSIVSGSGATYLGRAVSATKLIVEVSDEGLPTINIANLGDELAGTAILPTGNNAIDFKANIQYDKTLDAAWAPTFTNPIKGKSIVIIATGANAAYTLTVPATVKGDISGFDGTKTNQLTLYCLDATTPVYSIDVKTW